jgi:2-iminobutanoate/2-iminopropanoate deaminase
MKAISSSKAPAAIGPYSQAIDSGAGLVFVSGQLPIDPATGAFPEGGIKEQTA